MKIQDMPAGQEMDRLVAEKVMGWRQHARNTAFFVPIGKENEIMNAYYPADEWKPSTDIAMAWEAVERVTDIRLPRRADGFPPSTVFMHHFQKANLWAMSAEDAAAEICRCALIAVGCEVVP